MSNDLARLLSAASFAARKHRNQRRKDVGEHPYINHPLDVAALLAQEGQVTDIDLLVAALLHDTVEDTQTSWQELTDQFGAAVRDLVAEVTDDKSLPKQRRKELQIETAPHKSPRAKQIKLADKISNLRDIDADSPANWDRQRKVEYLNWAAQVIDGCRGVNARLEQLFDETLAAARMRVQ